MNAVLAAVVLALLGQQMTTQASYHVGSGIADVTESVLQTIAMGHRSSDSQVGGLHTRLFSRAFVIDNGAKLIAFVSVECAGIDRFVKAKVIEKLEVHHGGLYLEKNVMLSATHTRSGPGGSLQQAAYLADGFGWQQASFDALVDGIVLSIQRAHDKAVPARVSLSRGRLSDAGVNRSPAAYARNPATERAQYDGDTDDTVMQLNMVAADDQRPIGVINWFPVQLTSMSRDRRLVTSDNKGYASLLFESRLNPGHLIGKGSFVAAFAQSNAGDVSPDTGEPKCVDSGLPCTLSYSNCVCVSSGPGRDEIQSTKIIGGLQFKKALELFHGDRNEELDGDIDFIHQPIDMAEFEVDVETDSGRTEKVHLCKPALGYGFLQNPAASNVTSDHEEPINNANFLRLAVNVRGGRPSAQQRACHQPKSIMVNMGEIRLDSLEQRRIVNTQVLRIGRLLIVGLPGIFTTMAGRRIRQSVLSRSPPGTEVILAGLANAFSGYVTTSSEYQEQSFEGASTLFGPHTLEAYQQQLALLTERLFSKESALETATVTPMSPLPAMFPSTAHLVHDQVDANQWPGQCLVQPKATYKPGKLAVVHFVSSNPVNKHQDTFLTVEQFIKDEWVVVFTDADWETMMLWKTNRMGATDLEIRWRIPRNMPPGSYRIVHSGFFRQADGSLTPFSGATNTFNVLQSLNEVP